MPKRKPPDKTTSSIVLFEDKGIRRIWDKSSEKWLLAIVDLVGILTESKNPNAYWRKLKQRLKQEGNETVTNCHALKLEAADGKMRVTDVVDAEAMLRIVQSVPSPKAEPIKQWLAEVGSERIEEYKDPEKAIHRAVATYAAKGHDDEWINRRLRTIEVRNELTREWSKRGVKDNRAFALLTNMVYAGWSGMTSRQYKDLKGLTDENLRDHMTTLELVLNMLAEASTTEIARATDAQGIMPNREAASKGGNIAGQARKNLEETTGKPVISSTNHLPKSDDRKQLP